MKEKKNVKTTVTVLQIYLKCNEGLDTVCSVQAVQTIGTNGSSLTSVVNTFVVDNLFSYFW